MKQLLTILFVLSAVFAKSQAYIGSDGTIHPTGAFPVINSNEAKGTIKRANSLADRDALPVSLRDIGMLCWVSDSAKFYVLAGGIENFRWVDLITTGVVGGVAFERDPIFTNSPSYTITEQKKAYWDLVGLMLRADSVRSEIHDSIMVHQRPPINYDPNDFSVTNDTLHAIGKVNGESDPIFNNSVWGQLPDGKPEEWDAKVEQGALDDTAAAIRRSFKADTIYHDARDFYNTGGKNDPLRIKRYTNAQIDSLILANGGKIGDSSGLQFNLAGYYTKIQVDSIVAAFGGALQDGLIKPGYVTWSGAGYTYDVTGAVYVINSKPYKSSPGSITLDASDGALNRIDAIVVDTLGSIRRITGVAASNPVAPILDPSSQVLLTNVTVTAGSTGPNSLNTVVYNEEGFGEYIPTGQGVSANPSNTLFPFSGAKSLNVGGWVSGNTVTFTNSATASATSYTYIKLFIRLKSVVTDISSIAITFYNGSTPVSKMVSIVSYGINKKLVGVYQNVSVPMSVFGFTANSFNKIQIRFGGANADGAYIDYVQLQNSTVTETGSNALTDIYQKDGTDSLFKTVGGNSFFVTRIGGTSGGTVDTTLRRDININTSNITANTASIATKLNSNFGTQGSVLFRGANGVSESNNNFFYDSSNIRLNIGGNTNINSLAASPTRINIWSNSNNYQGIVSTNANNGGFAASALSVVNDAGVLGAIQQLSSNYHVPQVRNRTLFASTGSIAIASNADIDSGRGDVRIITAGVGGMPQALFKSNNHIIFGDSTDLADVHNYVTQTKGNAYIKDTLFAGYISTGGSTTSGSYTLPIASPTILGGVKVGSGLSIDGTGVLSSTGGSGASTDTTNLSRRINRKPRVYNVEDYGAVHNGVTNDQAAIQSAINAANAAGGGVVYFPNGIYILSGAVDASSGAQLYVPLNTYNRTDTLRVIKLMGETSPNQYSTPLVDATSNQQMPTTGVILQSTLQGSAGSIIGSRSQSVSWGSFNFAELQLENITTRAATRSGTTNTAATQTAIDGSKLAFISIRNVRVDVQPASDSIVTPATTSVGIYMPLVNNFAFTTLDKVMITGYYKGIIVSEHTSGDNVMIDGCYYGLSLQGTNYHGNQFNRIGIYRTKYNITVAASSRGQININQLALEDKMTGTEWFVNTADIDEGANSLWQGSIKFNRVVSTVGVVNTGFRRTTTTASNIKTVDATGVNYYQPSASQSGFGFYEQETTNGGFIGRAGSAFTANGAYTANDIMVYNNKDISIWSNQKIKFLSGASTPVEMGNIDGATGNMSLGSANPLSGQRSLTVSNSSAGATGQAIFIASNGSVTSNYGVTGSGYTTYGALTANSGYLYTPGANGLTFMVDQASAPIKFATGGNAEKMRLASTGNLLIGTTTDVTNKIFNVTSTTKTSHPYPGMTAAQRTALTMTASNVGDHVYQTDGGAGAEGVWVYKSTGWQFAY